jgi:hypothetical protein
MQWDPPFRTSAALATAHGCTSGAPSFIVD